VLALLLLYVSSSVAETRICLNMIAKDEAKEILSCLEPLAPELSGWTLCDTGGLNNLSTGQTMDVLLANNVIITAMQHHTVHTMLLA
jgi:hypothetical protein